MKVDKNTAEHLNHDLDRASLRYGLAKKKMNVFFASLRHFLSNG